MIIFYSKITGTIIASFPEAEWLAPEITVETSNDPVNTIAKAFVSHKDAHPFEDPRNPEHIHDYKVTRTKDGKLRLEKKNGRQ